MYVRDAIATRPAGGIYSPPRWLPHAMSGCCGLGGLGAFDVGSALTGGAIPLLAAGGVLLWLFFRGSKAMERKRQLAAARSEFRAKKAEIKAKYKRI